MELKDRIIEKSLELFLRLGIRSVTMDDIAKELGISKRTLYQHFTDKDTLVYDAIKFDIEKGTKECVDMSLVGKNAIDQVCSILEHIREKLSEKNPMILYDLEKFHHKAYELFLEHKNGFLTKIVEDNLKWGIEEELYRADINVEVLAKFRMETMLIVMSQRVFPKNNGYSIADIVHILSEHFLYGIASPKGYKMINKYFSTKNTN